MSGRQFGDPPPRRVSLFAGALQLRAEMTPADLPDIVHALALIAVALADPDVEYLAEQGVSEEERRRAADELADVASQLQKVAAQLKS